MTLTLEELNHKYYLLWYDLFCNRDTMSDRQYLKMSKALSDSYDYDYEKYMMENLIEDGQKMFELRYNKGVRVPRRGFLWRWNRVAKVLKKNLSAQFDLFISQLELDSSEIKKDNQVTNKMTEDNNKLIANSTLPVLVNNLPTENIEDKQSSNLSRPDEP